MSADYALSPVGVFIRFLALVSRNTRIEENWEFLGVCGHFADGMQLRFDAHECGLRLSDHAKVEGVYFDEIDIHTLLKTCVCEEGA